jgi:hypothetical protein
MYPLPCFTNFETKYMLANATRLAAGIAKIRQPGCFPHGKYIIAAGYYRTGSTLLYNTARLWGALGAPQTVIAGWGCPDRQALGLGHIKEVDTAATPFTAICKLHEMDQSIHQNDVRVVMSHREPWGSICSRKMENQWAYCTTIACHRKLMTAEKYNKCVRECSDSPDQKAAVKLSCRELMALQTNVYINSESANVTVGHDVPLESWHNDPFGEIALVGKSMGICKEAYEDRALVEMIHAMGVHLENTPSADQSTTQMHRVHEDSERDKVCSHIQAGIDADPTCKQWSDSGGLQEENAMLEVLRACGDQKHLLMRMLKRVDLYRNDQAALVKLAGEVCKERASVV